MLGSNLLKKRVSQGILHSNPFLGIESQHFVENIVHFLIVIFTTQVDKLHDLDLIEGKSFHIGWQFEVIVELFTFRDDLLGAEESGEFQQVTDVVGILYSLGFIGYFNPIENVVLASCELEEDYPHWPYV